MFGGDIITGAQATKIAEKLGWPTKLGGKGTQTTPIPPKA